MPHKDLWKGLFMGKWDFMRCQLGKGWGRRFIHRMVALTRNPNLTMTANTNRRIPKTFPGTCDVMDTEWYKWREVHAFASLGKLSSGRVPACDTCVHVFCALLGSRLRRSKFAISAAQQPYASLVYIYIYTRNIALASLAHVSSALRAGCFPEPWNSV